MYGGIQPSFRCRTISDLSLRIIILFFQVKWENLVAVNLLDNKFTYDALKRERRRHQKIKNRTINQL